MAGKKNNKNNKAEEKDKKVEETGTEESNLSDGVLDAFDDAEPEEVETDEIFVSENEEEDELDSGDFKMREEW